MMKQIITNSITLLEALALIAPESSKTTLRSWLKIGRVKVDGQVVKIGSEMLQKGQEVSVGEQQRFIAEEVGVIFEDQDIIAIDKPSGLLSVSTDFEGGTNLHGILKSKFKHKRVYPVHRLDQDTSGVIIFALSQRARDKLKSIFEKHEIERRYVALVEGHLKEKSGVWRTYQYEDKAYFVHTTQNPEKGKLAITHYKVIGESKKYSLLELQLETGRKNQIRVHCSEAGHPVLGDHKYGAKANPLKRLCLHAFLLALEHPTNGRSMRFESPIPPEFKQVVP